MAAEKQAIIRTIVINSNYKIIRIYLNLQNQAYFLTVILPSCQIKPSNNLSTVKHIVTISTATFNAYVNNHHWAVLNTIKSSDKQVQNVVTDLQL
jgi:hypothetical protein